MNVWTKMGMYILTIILIFSAGSGVTVWYYHKQAAGYQRTIANLTVTNEQLQKDNFAAAKLNTSITERQQAESIRLETAKRLVDNLSREFGETEVTISGIIDAIDNLIREFEDL